MTTGDALYDAIIIGAGFSGIQQLIKLRRAGLSCTLIDAGSDFGGTWHWNRYPGARVDTYIPNYELSLPELWKEWTWTEKYPGWQELQAYFTYVGDKLNLRPYCRFDTVVKQAHWDDQSHLWHVTAEEKEGQYKASARYLIPCIGSSYIPYIPNIKGRDTFKGQYTHTSQWPKGGIEVAGKRVGVIGTGASGVQVIQEIGPQVAHLTIFQRTPNMALPMGQYSVTKQVQDHFKPLYAELYKGATTTVYGIPYDSIARPLFSDSEEDRVRNFERLWDLGGANFWVGNYQDVLLERASNDVAYAFWREKVGKRIKDPRKRAILAPETAPHPFGTKRPSLEQRFYEVFNQDNVDLVDLRETPILEIDENSVKTADKEHALDVLIFATGFDTHVGAFKAIDLRGVNGKTIQDHWKDGVTTYLGLTIDKFPNLFAVYGPQAPTSFSNGPTCAELQGEWILKTIMYLRVHGVTKFMPTTGAALKFKKHVDDLCNATMLPLADSWYMGANIPGKKREAYNYSGGLAAYKEEIMTEIERGYPQFLKEALD